MNIIEVSEDQNTVKTDDGKEHNFVISKDPQCQLLNCSLYKSRQFCVDLCYKIIRKDKKNGYFKLK